jgi:hypothetical protein
VKDTQPAFLAQYNAHSMADLDGTERKSARLLISVETLFFWKSTVGDKVPVKKRKTSSIVSVCERSVMKKGLLILEGPMGHC